MLYLINVRCHFCLHNLQLCCLVQYLMLYLHRKPVVRENSSSDTSFVSAEVSVKSSPCTLPISFHSGHTILCKHSSEWLAMIIIHIIDGQTLQCAQLEPLRLIKKSCTSSGLYIYSMSSRRQQANPPWP